MAATTHSNNVHSSMHSRQFFFLTNFLAISICALSLLCMIPIVQHEYVKKNYECLLKLKPVQNKPGIRIGFWLVTFP